ncbi:hypothetical protein C8Q79DRAFT_269247 [Trametes meyenii]|nr:hypothetical protein C8Q79DRAFT_269247 [Trametes meyenii]
MRSLTQPPPIELCLIIRAFISLSDVRTHVCFYKVHPSIAALYDSEEDPDHLWHLICWHSGIGALDTDDLNDQHCWRNIAIEVIERDGFCLHPQCGEGLLVYNERNMAKTAKQLEPPAVFSDWKDVDDGNLGDDMDGLESDYNTSLITGNTNDGRHRWAGKALQPSFLTMHPALTSIAFRSEPSGGRYSMSEDAYLRCDTKVADTENVNTGNSWLHAHPLVQRSFATDVPSGTIIVGRTAAHRLSRGRVQRSTGVTIFDIVTAYHADLDVKLSSWELTTFVSDEVDFCGIPDGWSDSTLFERFNTLRDVFTIYSFAEFSWDGTIVEDGPLFWVDLTLTRLQ